MYSASLVQCVSCWYWSTCQLANAAQCFGSPSAQSANGAGPLCKGKGQLAALACRRSQGPCLAGAAPS